MIRKTALVTLFMIFVRIFLLGSATQAEFCDKKHHSRTSDSAKTGIEGSNPQQTFEQKYSAYFEKLKTDSAAFRKISRRKRKSLDALRIDFERCVLEQLANE